MKYIKKVKIAPNFKIDFEILSQGPRKKIWAQNKKKYILPSAMGGTQAKLIFKNKKNCRVPGAGTRQNKF